MKQKLIFGTLLLTGSGIVCRLVGFFYRIFLTHAIGAEGMGIYQLIVPVYHLSYAICTAGIQTSLSRLVAAYTAKKEYTKAIFTFIVGTALSFILSLCISFLIKYNSVFLSEHILKDTRCIPLLQLLSFALPFGALHGCIIGWFMGRKQVHIPAGMQILEELIRLVSTYLCYQYYIHNHLVPSASLAVFGMLIGEISSVIFSLVVIRNYDKPHDAFPDLRFYLNSARELLTNSFPLTMNRVALNLLHSIEAILIPLSLEKYQMTRTEALKTLGTVSGMALPLVLFPTAIINALSSILLPTVSESQALQNPDSIKKLIKKTSLYAVTIGLFCTIFFSIFGNYLGKLFYHSTEAGTYITILALISPFLYIDIILASVMNGLGKTSLCFLVNFLNMCLRVFCIYFLIPTMGIAGYLIGLIGGEIFCTILSIVIIYMLVYSKHPIDK